MAPKNIHELIIFNRVGQCIYHHDFHKSKQEGDLKGLVNVDAIPNDILQKQKLVFGLLWSLKSFSGMVSSQSFFHLILISCVDILWITRLSF